MMVIISSLAVQLVENEKSSHGSLRVVRKAWYLLRYGSTYEVDHKIVHLPNALTHHFLHPHET